MLAMQFAGLMLNENLRPKLGERKLTPTYQESTVPTHDGQLTSRLQPPCLKLSVLGSWMGERSMHHGPVSPGWDGRCLDLPRDAIGYTPDPQTLQEIKSLQRGRGWHQTVPIPTSCFQNSWSLLQVDGSSGHEAGAGRGQWELGLHVSWGSESLPHAPLFYRI